MSETIRQVADGVWNTRGELRLGPLDIGTHATLIRREDGSFILLDGYTLSDEQQAEVFGLTDGGTAVAHVLHLHPFHTLHVQATYALFPHARLVGTDRHKQKAPDLPWDPLTTDDPKLHDQYEELVLSVPAGVQFVADDPRLHFASVLAKHAPTGTAHIDDTLSRVPLPGIFGGTRILFHPTLGKVLEERSGAATDFRQWAEELASSWDDVQVACFAHRGVSQLEGGFGSAVRRALSAVSETLDKHARRHG